MKLIKFMWLFIKAILINAVTLLTCLILWTLTLCVVLMFVWFMEDSTNKGQPFIAYGEVKDWYEEIYLSCIKEPIANMWSKAGVNND